MFLEQRADKLPLITEKTYKIKIREAKPLYRLIYTLSAIKLKALREYLDSSLKKG